MKFRCERDVLADAVGSAGRATSGRGGALPVLAGLRLRLEGDHLEVTGSDLDLTVTAEIEVAGGDDGVAVIPARLLADIVRALEPGAVNVTVEADEATITGGRSEFSVNVIPPEEYPQIAEPTADSVTLSAAALADGLRQVVPAASNDDNRLILTGVQLAAEGDGLRLVATDSYRLAVRDLAGQSVLEEGQSVLVPSRPCRGDPLAWRCQRGHPGARRPGRHVSHRRGAGHHPADHRRFPQLPRPDPRYPGQHAHRRSAGADRRRPSREVDGSRIDPGSAGDDPQRARVGGGHPGRRSCLRAARRQLRGRGPDHRLQPGLPARWPGCCPRRRGSGGDDRGQQAGGAARLGGRRLPVPADARTCPEPAGPAATCFFAAWSCVSSAPTRS